MLSFSRSASVTPGKFGDAIEFGHLIARYIKETYGTTLEVLAPIGGDPNRITWHAHYASLAEWEATSARLLADKVYVEMISKQTNTFVAGSVRDELWRTI